MSDILIVDDSPDDRALFRTILRRAGFTVHEAATGGAAPGLAREARPHVVILDVNLPDTTGHDVCRAFRADPTTAGLPVLMLTAFDNDRDVLAALEAGADDYIAKDAAPEVFLARVRRLVRYRQMATTSVLNEQLAQIGRLLAGIVHEIRGPLSVIRGNAELLRLRLTADDPNEPFLDPILRNCQILQARLEHLMAAVRVGPSLRTALDVGPLVREAADLFFKGIDPRQGRVALATELAAGLPPVLADAGRLIQVVLNLLANAHEAVVAARAVGRITLTTAPARDEGGAWVVVEVCDDGPGIPEPYLGRIFEPCFTTKEKGSGYGLYLASEILREHGGRLTAANIQGGGARFTMWLPQAPTAAGSGPFA